MTPEQRAVFDTTLTTRGYTGHEMVDPVGLIHMNGRVYDAEIGRFLSADPHVQAADNLQNWNRYSYVLNNPLSYTDPTGYFFKKLFKKIGKAIGKVFKAIGRALKKALASPIFRAILNIVACGLPGVGQLACAAISTALSAAGTLAAGGSIGDALRAAAFTVASIGAFKFVGSYITPAIKGIVGSSKAALAVGKAVVHGVVGGALRAAQGGNFLEGFASSAFSAAAGVFTDGISGGDPLLDTAIVAAVGCAGAVLGGGKCANGAISAAFANLYNRFGCNAACRKAIRKDAQAIIDREVKKLPPGVKLEDLLEAAKEIAKLEHYDIAFGVSPRLAAFRAKYRSPYEWDFKRVGNDYRKYEDVGNFFFGFLGIKSGLGSPILRAGAGYYQGGAFSNPFKGAWNIGRRITTLGDDPNDYYHVGRGISAARRSGL